MFTGVLQRLWPEQVAEGAGQADYVIERLAALIA